jgi:hypothetical protein
MKIKTSENKKINQTFGNGANPRRCKSPPLVHLGTFA